MDAKLAAARAWDLRVNMTRVAISILHHGADAEDAVATAMLNAYKGAQALQEEDRFNAWVMRILVRCCHDLLRKRKREVLTEDMAAYDEPVLENTEGTLFEAILALPEAYRKVLVLFYYEGFKAKEIAKILSMPLGTVLVYLSRGRSKLKENLQWEEEAHNEKQAI